ncbi:MAG: hypothetical protein ACE5OR_08400 [bacterium]
MPAGDAQRTWFPEMIELLQEKWNSSMSWEELIELRNHLDSILQTIRTERNILPPMMWCPRCKKRHRSAPPKVSVRATIFALGRFGIVAEPEVKTLEKGWKKYSREHDLDMYGKRKYVITNVCGAATQKTTKE